MATTTATIFIGYVHQNNSGINPTHFIQFTENDRPALILRDIEGKNERIVIIPTLENTIDDIYLLIGIYILNQIKPSKKIDNFERISLYEILSESERLSLYKETLLLLSSKKIKVVFNILGDSHLLKMVDQIKKYSNDFEVTIPAIKKEYSAWSNKIETKGI